MRKPLPIGRADVFEGVGFCIYCKATGKPLRDEHVIPYSLAGNLVLAKGSCQQCEATTSRIERKICIDHLGQFREALDFPTRRPKRRKNTIRGQIQSQGKEMEVFYSWKEFPATLTLPKFEEPGMLVGRKPSDSFSIDIWAAEIQKVDRAPNPGLKYSFDVNDWLRFIAKVCHSAAYAFLGTDCDSYQQFLPKIIAGNSDHQTHYVGGVSSKQTTAQGETVRAPLATHCIRLEKRNTTDGREILLVEFEIFQGTGAPAYKAVFGEKALPMLPMSPLDFRKPRFPVNPNRLA